MLIGAVNVRNVFYAYFLITKVNFQLFCSILQKSLVLGYLKMSVPLTTLLGETVQAKDGRVTKLVSELVGEEKVVGLYFSNVSSAFTSKLITWYNDFKETENGSKFEIVMVSSDYCRVDFDEQDSKCYPEIPWLTLDYEKQDKKVSLCSLLNVNTCVFFSGCSVAQIQGDER